MLFPGISVLFQKVECLHVKRDGLRALHRGQFATSSAMLFRARTTTVPTCVKWRGGFWKCHLRGPLLAFVRPITRAPWRNSLGCRW
jgi:hypothetical protein